MKKKTISPIIDRILMNPLKFIQNNSLETVNEVHSSKIVVLSNPNTKPESADPEINKNSGISTSSAEKAKPTKKRPVSMAEALQAYTGRQYGTSNTKRRKVAALADSDEDLGEEIAVTPQIADSNSKQGTDFPDHETNTAIPSPSPSSSDVFESAHEYNSSSSDSDYNASQNISPSESPSAESPSDPEDLDTLKAVLRDDLEQDVKDPGEPGELEIDVPASATGASPSSSSSQAEPESSAIDTSGFYDFNEFPRDRGSNGSRRINKSFVKSYTNRKPLGLLNQGVTCYMNTAIQSMVHIPAITNYLAEVHSDRHNKTLPVKSVTHVLAELAHRLWNLDNNKKKYIHPKRVINRLGDINCMMSEWQQEDSHEYFMSLMSRLQEDSTPKGVKLNKSIIYDIFGGLLNQTVVCERCHNKSTTKQEFYDLSLGFKKRKQSKYSISRSLKDFFSQELIKTDNQDKESGYFCEKCRLNTNALKHSTVDIAPEYLTVHLKRFKFNGSQSMKVKQSMKYSNYLDMTDYTTKKSPTVYQLISIISHEGRSLSSGHYISHCLQPDKSWYTYDDEYINKISEIQALNDPSAYVLIYSKMTPKSG